MVMGHFRDRRPGCKRRMPRTDGHHPPTGREARDTAPDNEWRPFGAFKQGGTASEKSSPAPAYRMWGRAFSVPVDTRKEYASHDFEPV